MEKLTIAVIVTLLLTNCGNLRFAKTARGPALKFNGKITKIEYSINAKDVAAIIKAVNGYKQIRKRCETKPACDVEKPGTIETETKIFKVAW
jgi:hypothetical protein